MRRSRRKDSGSGYLEFTADVDGDGRSELVVGAIGENGAAANAGAVYVVYAPPPPS